MRSTTTSTDHGFALAGDATLNCTIATKEGAASGHPAVLEIEIVPGDGSIGGTQLASSTLTLTAGSGLSGGGSVALGGNVTLSLGTDLTLGGTTSGTFSGDGAALTNLDAASITTGNLANNRLSNNIPRLTSATTVFTGSLAAASFSGDGSALTNLAAPANGWRLGGNAGTTAGTHFLGPMAQSFKAAFYPGRDDTVITTLEFDGVELAAIQGLNRKLTEKLAEKDAEIADLRERLTRIERALDNRPARMVPASLDLK